MTQREVLHKKAQRTHATNRAEERYDIQYTSEIRKILVSQIKNHKALFVKKESSGYTVWYVEYEKKLAKVVYDAKKNEIVTFLPVKYGEYNMINLNRINNFGPGKNYLDINAYFGVEPL